MSNQKKINVEELDRESNTRSQLPKLIKTSLIVLTVVISLFHLYTSFAGPLVDVKQRSVHLFGLMAIGYVLYPFLSKKRNKSVPYYDYMLSAVSLAAGIYMFQSAERIAMTGGQINNTDFIVGIIILLMLLDLTRRVTGWGLTLLGAGFLVYGVCVKLSIYPDLNSQIFLTVTKKIISQLVFITEGILGTAIGVSASYIILFILFGAFLGRSGMGKLFNDLALAIAGHTKGGPAKVAVIASGFLGSINGSAVANVVTTGAFTIPLMKKVGYHKNFAGAVEAAASVGGQILPPVMGAAAFIMAENLGVPYTKIILAGIIPALLYYIGILLQVHFRASKRGLIGVPKSELPSAKEVLAERGHLLIPMFILLYLLFSGKTPFYAAFWSIVATVIIAGSKKLLTLATVLGVFFVFQPQVISLLSGEKIPGLKSDWWEHLLIIAIPLGVNLLRRWMKLETEEMGMDDCIQALDEGARTSIPVAVACGAVGIVVGVASLTGVALEIANSIVGIGAMIDSPLLQLIITLLLTMLTSIVLGMGVPSIPTYIITSTMAAPILLQLPLFRELAGSTETAIFIAHMFVFYFGIFANITPPVALAAFAGAGLSGGDPTKTGFQAMKLAFAGFIVPYMFVFAHELLMIDATVLIVIQLCVSSVIGVFLLSLAIEGYFKRAMPLSLRLVSAAAALLLIHPGLVTDIMGFVVFVFILIWNYRGKTVSEGTNIPS